MSEFRMPSLGADMEKGVLVEWNFREGDHVKKGDIIALVETDKGLIDVEIFQEGVIKEIKVQPGKEVPVGQVLAVIGGEEDKEKKTGKQPPAEKSLSKEQKKEKRIRASPRARRLAAELGVDLETVKGTGPLGAIEGEDVERAGKAGRALKEELPSAKKTESIDQKKSGMRIRQAIAAAMSRSNKEIPHYYLEKTIEMTQALKWLEKENSKRSIKERFLPAVLLIKSTALALRDVPELNGFWMDDRLQLKEEINIGLSVSLRKGGLINAAVKNADKMDLDEIRENMNDLIARARSGRLKSSELSDSTITLTYLGDMGAEVVYGVIYPPQVAIVGFGKIIEKPLSHEGMIGIRPVIRATLAADHRATDGMLGSRFLEALNGYLQEVEKL